MKRVVITGIGIVSSAGIGVDATWRRLRAETLTPITYIDRANGFESIGFPVYQVPDYKLRAVGVPDACSHWLSSEGVEDARDLRHLLASAALALADASISPQPLGLDSDVGVLVADEHPGVEQLCQKLFAIARDEPLPETVRERYSLLAREVFHLNTFLYPHYLARAYRLGGMCLYLNSACASGLNALDIAAQQIRAGRCNLVLAAAADDPLSVAKYLWFKEMGLYASDGVVRPFDADQQGTVFGDGGTTIVLEDLDSAISRGARIYAEFLGAGFAQDGWKTSTPNPALWRGKMAFMRALQDSHVSISEIDLVVPHGTGARASDEYEARVLTEIFGSQGKWPAITALKPFVGNNLGGSSMMETALLLLSLSNNCIPPTLGHRRPFKRYPIPLVRDWLECPVRIAVKFTCALGGYFGAAIFGRY